MHRETGKKEGKKKPVIINNTRAQPPATRDGLISMGIKIGDASGWMRSRSLSEPDLGLTSFASAEFGRRELWPTLEAERGKLGRKWIGTRIEDPGS